MFGSSKKDYHNVMIIGCHAYQTIPLEEGVEEEDCRLKQKRIMITSPIFTKYTFNKKHNDLTLTTSQGGHIANKQAKKINFSL